jgi:hypothetical protein
MNNIGVGEEGKRVRIEIVDWFVCRLDRCKLNRPCTPIRGRVVLSHRRTNMVLLLCRFMKFSLDWAKIVMGLFKLVWAQFECQHMPPILCEWCMNLKTLNQTKPNSDNTHLIGCLVTKGDVYIAHFCSKGDICIGHCLESTYTSCQTLEKHFYKYLPLNALLRRSPYNVSSR